MCVISQVLWKETWRQILMQEVYLKLLQGTTPLKQWGKNETYRGRGWNARDPTTWEVSERSPLGGQEAGLYPPLSSTPNSYWIRTVPGEEIWPGHGSLSPPAVRTDARALVGGTQLWASSSQHLLEVGKWKLSSQRGGALIYNRKALWNSLDMIKMDSSVCCTMRNLNWMYPNVLEHSLIGEQL